MSNEVSQEDKTRTYPPPYRPFDKPVTQRAVANAVRPGAPAPLAPLAGPPVYRPATASVLGQSKPPVQHFVPAPVARPMPSAIVGQPGSMRTARPAIQRAVGLRRFVRQASLQRFPQASGSIQAKFVKSSTEASTEVVPESILDELESMLDAADKQKGQASPNLSDSMKMLLGADKHFKDQLATQSSKKMSSRHLRHRCVFVFSRRDDHRICGIGFLRHLRLGI
jgi:predicted lipid-binding transport protein (Tim44 family)